MTDSRAPRLVGRWHQDSPGTVVSGGRRMGTLGGEGGVLILTQLRHKPEKQDRSLSSGTPLQGHQCVGGAKDVSAGRGPGQGSHVHTRAGVPSGTLTHSCCGHWVFSNFLDRFSVRISSATPFSFFPKGQFGSIEVNQELRSTLTFEPHLCLPLNSFETLSKVSLLSPFPPL